MTKLKFLQTILGILCLAVPACAQVAVGTLSSGVNATTLTLPYTQNSNGYLPSGTVAIDNERMIVCSATTTSVTVCGGGRGANSTTAVSHLSGATLYTGTSVLSSNTSGSASAAIACAATPGNTTGTYRQQCQTSAGALYACNNAAGCTVAADWIAAGGTPNPLNSVAIQDKGGQVYNAKAYGMVCDDSTDDTTAFNALLSTVNTAGGGTIYLPAMCLISGAVVFPNNGGTFPALTQSSIRITGGSSAANVYGATTPSSGLDLRYNAAVAKLDTRAIGYLEIDHLALIDGGSDCAAFIQSTNTNINIHDNAFRGTTANASACNDGIVFGGTTTTMDGSSTAAFQGYGSSAMHNMFNRIRRAGYFRVYSNATRFSFNTVAADCGSNIAGAAIEMNGGGFGSGAHVFVGNLIELTNYALGVKVTDSANDTFDANSFHDNTSSSCFNFPANSAEMVTSGQCSNTTTPFINGDTNNFEVQNSSIWSNFNFKGSGTIFFGSTTPTVRWSGGTTVLGYNTVVSPQMADNSNHWVSDTSVGFALDNALFYKWSNSGSTWCCTWDTALGRNAAGVVEINNGANAGYFRDLKLRTINNGGWGAGTESGCNTFTDLAVDSSSNNVVGSASYTFVVADVGGWIDITAGAGFTTGRYTIIGLSGAKVFLDRSPGATSTAGGTFITNRGRVIFTAGATTDTLHTCMQASSVYGWH